MTEIEELRVALADAVGRIRYLRSEVGVRAAELDNIRASPYPEEHTHVSQMLRVAVRAIPDPTDLDSVLAEVK